MPLMLDQRFRRIHLSTLVALMFLWAIIMMLNFQATVHRYGEPLWEFRHVASDGGFVYELRRVKEFGWPASVRTVVEDTGEFGRRDGDQGFVSISPKSMVSKYPSELVCKESNGSVETVPIINRPLPPDKTSGYRLEWYNMAGLMANLAVGGGAIFLSAFLFELLIRRRRRRSLP